MADGQERVTPDYEVTITTARGLEKHLNSRVVGAWRLRQVLDHPDRQGKLLVIWERTPEQEAALRSV